MEANELEKRDERPCNDLADFAAAGCAMQLQLDYSVCNWYLSHQGNLPVPLQTASLISMLQYTGVLLTAHSHLINSSKSDTDLRKTFSMHVLF